jgi:hypothetical protein
MIKEITNRHRLGGRGKKNEEKEKWGTKWGT